jgi:uncharacterized membrane protein
MKKFSFLDVAALVIWLLPIGYLLWVYAALPATVPMHYGIDGKPNSYGSKSEFLTVSLIFPLVSALLYFLLKFLPSIDPKKQVKYGEATFMKLAFGMVIFMAAISIAITFATVNQSFRIDKLLLPLVGLLFVFLGNLMHSIKPNYFAGVRTPWTLEDEGNWRATHRLAGKVFFAGGIIITIAVLVAPENVAIFIFMPCVLVMAFVPITYSYIYFKKHQLK